MVSSRKETKPRSDGVNTTGIRSTRSSGSKPKKNIPNKFTITKKAPEVTEISESSSSGSVQEARVNVVSKIRNTKKREEEEEGGGGEEAKSFRFPMNRIRRIMRSDDSAPQIMQDAVFLVNKATEMFIERFSEEAYESSVLDKKKFIHYKHLSSVVSNEERYEFLADCVPEKIRAEDALEEWEKAMTEGV